MYRNKDENDIAIVERPRQLERTERERDEELHLRADIYPFILGVICKERSTCFVLVPDHETCCQTSLVGLSIACLIKKEILICNILRIMPPRTMQMGMMMKRRISDVNFWVKVRVIKICLDQLSMDLKYQD